MLSLVHTTNQLCDAVHKQQDLLDRVYLGFGKLSGIKLDNKDV